MDKLQYDSLYKFFVSLGIILIALPIVALAYLINGDLVLISQTEFDALSEYSQKTIMYRESLTSYFTNMFPWICLIFMCIGGLFLCYGVYKWQTVQNNLDKKLNAEATMQALSLMEMNSKEIEDKVEAEVKEDVSAEMCDETNSSTVETQMNRIDKYKEIEDQSYNFFATRYARTYGFKRNIRMGKHHYDFIGVSKNDDTDLIVEVKYFGVASMVSRRLHEMLWRLHEAGSNYKAIAHRECKLIVFIVTPKEQLPQLERQVETRVQQLFPEYAKTIEIRCMAEEAL